MTPRPRTGKHSRTHVWPKHFHYHWLWKKNRGRLENFFIMPMFPLSRFLPYRQSVLLTEWVELVIFHFFFGAFPLLRFHSFGIYEAVCASFLGGRKGSDLNLLDYCWIPVINLYPVVYFSAAECLMRKFLGNNLVHSRILGTKKKGCFACPLVYISFGYWFTSTVIRGQIEH